MVMKIWLKAYIWTLSNMKKTDFQNLHFEGGLPYTPTLKMCQFAVVQDNLSQLKSHLHEIWAQYVFWANLKHCEVGFLNFDFLRGAAIYP